MTPEDLVEMELIKRLKYAYMRCIDQKLWAELRTLFVDDAVVAYNTLRESFSTNLIAGPFSFGPAELFVIERPEAKETPKVSLS